MNSVIIQLVQSAFDGHPLPQHTLTMDFARFGLNTGDQIQESAKDACFAHDENDFGGTCGLAGVVGCQKKPAKNK
jgi:hypothetical protein